MTARWWWRFRIRRHFCWACDKPTVLEHRHASRPFEHLLRDEWRSS